MSTLGRRMAQARRELGVREGRDITPPDMAARLEVAAATYWRWERDERRPNGAALKGIADALGVDSLWLASGIITAALKDAEPNAPNAVPVHRLPPEAPSAPPPEQEVSRHKKAPLHRPTRDADTGRGRKKA